MKMAMINTLYYPNLFGGAERTLSQIAEGMVGLGHTVEVYTTSLDDKYSESSVNGVLVKYFPLANLYHPYVGDAMVKQSLVGKFRWHLQDFSNASMAKRVEDALRGFQPDVVSTHCLAGFSREIWRTCEKLSIPIVHVLHDYYLLCARSAMYSKRKVGECGSTCIQCRLLRSDSASRSEAVTAVIGVSRHILQAHTGRRLFSRARNREVVFNSVNLEQFSETRRDDFSQSRIRLGFMGTLIPEKGLHTIVAAMKLLRLPNLVLKVFGRGSSDYMESVKRSADDLMIEFHGHVPAPKAFAEIDVLIVPSLWDEPFGRVVIEGFAANLIVVASRRGGISEIMEMAGSKRVYEPRDVQSLCTQLLSISSLSQDDYRAEASRGSEIAVQFSEAAMLSRYAKVFEGIVVSG